MIREQWRLTNGPEWPDIETPSGLIVADGVQREIAEHIVNIHNAALAARPDRDAAALEALGLLEHWRLDAQEYASWAYQYRDKVFKAEDILRAVLAAQDRTGGSDGG